MWLDRWKARRALRRKAIPEVLWNHALTALPFLHELEPGELRHLRTLSSLFLDHKQFTGVNGFEVTDQVALLVAVQACLPLLHMAPENRPWMALEWYDDFVGIVMQPSEVVARRTTHDDSGVVHYYTEVIDGEAMEGGPVMLSWPMVADAAVLAMDGYNLVIHEFIHKMDMRNGPADGCPPLPSGFMGHANRSSVYQEWNQTWGVAYDDFRQQVIMYQRFGAPPPWLDAYAASAPAEFFAVACEAYFVNRTMFLSLIHI